MASLSAVEDFLYGKVYRSAAAAEQARAAVEAAAAAARHKVCESGHLTVSCRPVFWQPTAAAAATLKSQTCWNHGSHPGRQLSLQQVSCCLAPSKPGCVGSAPQRSLLPLLQAANKSSPGPAATPSRAAMVADRSPQAAASDAHIGAALAREAEPSGRSSREEAQQSTAALGAGAAGAGARRPRSAKQDIPHGKTTASQRMTRASARRAAAELDHHQAPAGEEAVQAQASEAVPAEGPSGTSEEDEGMMMMEVS